MTKEIIAQRELKRLLHYNPETGLFTRLVTAPNSKAGSGLTTKHCAGYIQVQVSNRQYLAHRLAFLYMTGAMPNEIDHINHNRTDNRWSNIQNVTHIENQHNMSKHKDNASGVNGVYWHNGAGKWMAYISVERKRIHLGLHNCITAAAIARKAADIKHGFHPNHGV